MLSRVTFWAHDNSQQQQKKKCLKSWYMNVLSAVQIDSMLFFPRCYYEMHEIIY